MMKEFLENYQLKITNFERMLPRFMKAEYFPVLHEAMSYSLFAKGKRVRPILVFETGRMFECGQDKLENFAVAIEMIHAYSLIHDDLPCIDNDDTRRGIPTNHKVYGEANAVLAGDALLSLAFEVMLDSIKTLGEPGIKAMEYIAKMAGPSGMISGQCADLHFENIEERTLKDLIYIHKKKTGGLMTAAIVSAAIIAGANGDELDILEEFGENLGILFQITDDILDVEGTKEELGKSIGKDMAKNKFTFVGFNGIEKAKELAQEKAEECKEIISRLKRKKGFFVDLIDYLLVRKK